MFAALQEAQYAFEDDEIPIGAVVVHHEKIIGRGRNLVEKLKDSTAHAEIVAITAASNHLQSKYLSECDLYITAEPCLMCSGAILLARLRSVYFAAYEPKFGAAGSLYNLLEEDKYNHKVKVFSGIYENESKQLLEKFFKTKRVKN
jgi:tRNA(adenine34) deaminase